MLILDEDFMAYVRPWLDEQPSYSDEEIAAIQRNDPIDLNQPSHSEGD